MRGVPVGFGEGARFGLLISIYGLCGRSALAALRALGRQNCEVCASTSADWGGERAIRRRQVPQKAVGSKQVQKVESDVMSTRQMTL